jgi:hypothetical protein
MPTCGNILDKFKETIPDDIRDRIESLFIDQDAEDAFVQFVADSILAVEESVAVLDQEVEVYDNILRVVIESLNDHLDSKLVEILDKDNTEDNFLTWHPDTFVPISGNNPEPGDIVQGSYTPSDPSLPTPEESGGKYKIPYQINYGYLDNDTSSRTNGHDPELGGALVTPGLREPFDPPITATHNGDTRTMPGLRRPESDPNYEFFSSGVEIYYYQPINTEGEAGQGEPEGPIVAGEKKVVVYSTLVGEVDNSPLISAIDCSKVYYYIFELLRNDSEQTAGAYLRTVNEYSSIDRLQIQKTNLLFKNSLLREMMEHE